MQRESLHNRFKYSQIYETNGSKNLNGTMSVYLDLLRCEMICMRFRSKYLASR